MSNVHEQNETTLIECPHCETRFGVPSEILKYSSEEEAPQFHCSRCDNLFEITEESEAAVSPAAENEREQPVEPEVEESPPFTPEAPPEAISVSTSETTITELDTSSIEEPTPLRKRKPTEDDVKERLRALLSGELEEEEIGEELEPIARGEAPKQEDLFQQTPKTDLAPEPPAFSSDPQPEESEAPQEAAAEEQQTVEEEQVELPTWDTNNIDSEEEDSLHQAPENDPEPAVDLVEDEKEDDETEVRDIQDLMWKHRSTREQPIFQKGSEGVVHLNAEHEGQQGLLDKESGPESFIMAEAPSYQESVEVSRNGSFALLAAPMVVIISLLWVGGSFLSFEHQTKGALVQALYPNSLQPAPAELYLKELSFEPFTLPTGDEVYVLEGALVNRTEQPFSEVALEAVLFGERGEPIETKKITAGMPINLKIPLPTTEQVIAQADEQAKIGKTIKEGESRKIKIIFPEDAASRATFYSARIYGVRS